MTFLLNPGMDDMGPRPLLRALKLGTEPFRGRSEREGDGQS